MIRGRCPVCSKSFEAASLDEMPSFPFCSERCRLIDLGRWVDGAYVIPGAESETPPKPEGVPEDEGDYE